MSRSNRRLGDAFRSLLRRPAPTPPDDDPDALLQRSIDDAREQHSLVVDQAAVIVAAQTRARARLDRAIDDYEQATTDAQSALLLADQRAQAGDVEGAEAQRRAAEAAARRLVVLELEIEELKRTALEATEASDAARAAVTRSAALLRQRIEERERLLARLETARLQERINAGTADRDMPLGDDAPEIRQARRSIEERLATARALAELRPETVDEALLTDRQARAEEATQARLDALRGPLGLDGRELRADDPKPSGDRTGGALSEP